MTWPQEIRKPHIYCNFKPSRKERMKKKERAADKRPGMSEKHLECIRKMPCCVSLKVPAGEAHHLKAGTGERGMGLRSTDRWALPVCREVHDEIERQGSRNEIAWFKAHGIEDPIELAAALWANTGDLPRMIAVLMAHRGMK